MGISHRIKLKRKQDKIYVLFLITVMVFDYLLFPLPIMAQVETEAVEQCEPFLLVADKTESATIAGIDGEIVACEAGGPEHCLFLPMSFAAPDKSKEIKKIAVKKSPKAILIKKDKIESNKSSVAAAIATATKEKTTTTIDIGHHSMTAYTSEAAQTDSSPCITANGFNVCKHGIEDTVAANFLPFGAKVRIPELFGDRVFVVRDRMNRRYSERVDVWMNEKHDALHFGVRVAKIEVINE